MKFSAYVVFILLWATLVYDPLAHWVWGADGWLHKLGALDFAGGTVVHISSGRLGAGLRAGHRQAAAATPSEAMRPHNLTMTLLGAGLLWFGWFGFNAGSALARMASRSAPSSTPTSRPPPPRWPGCSSSGCTDGEPTVLGAASGAVAGLVGITPASGFVGRDACDRDRGAGRAVCYLAVMIKSRFGYDDSLDPSACTASAAPCGRAADRRLRLEADQQRRRQRAALRQPRADGAAVVGVWQRSPMPR